MVCHHWYQSDVAVWWTGALPVLPCGVRVLKKKLPPIDVMISTDLVHAAVTDATGMRGIIDDPQLSQILDEMFGPGTAAGIRKVADENLKRMKR